MIHSIAGRIVTQGDALGLDSYASDFYIRDVDCGTEAVVRVCEGDEATLRRLLAAFAKQTAGTE